MAQQVSGMFSHSRSRYRLLTMLCATAVLEVTACCPPRRAAVLSTQPTGLEGLAVANALHRSLAEVASPLGVVVLYQGSLSWGDQRGVRSAGVPDEWCVATRREVDAAGRAIDLSRLLFTVKLHGSDKHPENATFFKHAGRRYALTISVPDGDERWQEVCRVLGMSPVAFVQEVARQASDN